MKQLDLKIEYINVFEVGKEKLIQSLLSTINSAQSKYEILMSIFCYNKKNNFHYKITNIPKFLDEIKYNSNFYVDFNVVKFNYLNSDYESVDTIIRQDIFNEGFCHRIIFEYMYPPEYGTNSNNPTKIYLKIFDYC